MAIDLSRLPNPTIIETLDYETMQADFLDRFASAWGEQRAKNAALPEWNVAALETDPTVITSEAWSYLRLLDRQHVNDVIVAVLAPLATGNDLDNIVARIGVERLIVVAATDTTDAVMESDARLLQRYLLAFTRPAAGSTDRYLYEAMTAWPSMLAGRVIGRAIHGRKGDVDIVVSGPDGRDATDEELAAVRTACTSTSVKPEATSVSVLRATRNVYNMVGKVTVPSGPDAESVRLEAVSRILAAGKARMTIGAEVPVNALEGAAYGTSVTRANLTAPTSDIPSDPYTMPIPGTITLTVEVSG
jgi:phage-related baseplate assembly protein